jgi:hypothetical protein
MDCLIDPYARGEEDGNTGVFTGTADSRIVVVYVPNPGRWIAVAEIRYV